MTPAQVAANAINTNLALVDRQLRRLANESEGDLRNLYRRAIVANERTRSLLAGASGRVAA